MADSIVRSQKRVEREHGEYMRSMRWERRLRARWRVDGPTWMFLGFVVSLQIGLGGWQLGKYLSEMKYRHAFGWGVALAKTCAGVLYPTLFFLVLSMSRYLSTLARRSYYLSRLINWDLSQSFHIKISVVALVFATLHAIGHLTGSFLYGSRPAQQDYVAAVLGPEAVPKPYIDYVRSLPGWSGLTAFALFWLLATLSMPVIRKRSYEIFQLGHLLMFPIIALLMAHGTAGLLQYPMLGYWLAFPTLLVLLERLMRVACGFHRISAKLEILDADTVVITATILQYRYWRYEAGQYVFLQVPQISFVQWHPFTISTYVDNEMQVHIKTDGNWTSQVRDLAKKGVVTEIHIGIDGPFGAPAQRFYDFDTSIILGSGIGVTPFSGILTDLQTKESRASSSSSKTEKQKTPVHRRVDFHWIVQDKNYLLWFSDLLNCVSESSCSRDHLDIRIYTHVTWKRKDISTHIYRYLLERHRTSEHPASPLTGLLNKTQFGRPDLGAIMEDHYKSLLVRRKSVGGEVERARREKVGVFFCGAPAIGMELADRCHRLTVRAREERTEIEYHFMMEVFG